MLDHRPLAELSGDLMSAPVKLAAFAIALAVVFGSAVLVGWVLDPTERTTGAQHGSADVMSTEARHGVSAGGQIERKDGAAPEPSGLAVSEGGYSFELDRRFFSAGESTPFTFLITDRRGSAVRDEFELEHDKQLHLVVVRRDTTVFKHLHPRKGQDGTWSVALILAQPGVYRVYADFKIDGVRRTLAADLFVPGVFIPSRLPAPVSVARVATDTGQQAENLDVELEPRSRRAGGETPLSFMVTRGGQPFEKLEPYLGARGHLVALREGDLAYLHVHPVESAESSQDAHSMGSAFDGAHPSKVRFATTFPTAGRYRLFLQFKTGGRVRLAAYTLKVSR